MSRVHVIGSVNIDLWLDFDELPHAGQTVAAKSGSRMPGGKGNNQAVAAALSGGRVTLVASVGFDAETVLEPTIKAGVNTQHVFFRDEIGTGGAIVCVDPAGENFVLIASGANILLTPQVLDNYVLENVTESDIVLLQHEIPMETVHHALKQAREVPGARTILNPTPYYANDIEYSSLVDVLIPNSNEFFAFCGKENKGDDLEAVAAVARELPDDFPTLIVTCGGQGAVVRVDGKLWHIPPIVIEVVDTTGAGDTFCGVFASAWSYGMDVLRAAQRASIAAGLSVSARGAQGSMPTPYAIEQMALVNPCDPREL